MNTFMTCHPNGTISFIVRLETPDGSAYGEDRFELELDQGIGQYSYEELRQHGSGYIDINFLAQPKPQAA